MRRHTFNTGLSLRLPKDWTLERNESERLFFQDPQDTEGIITFWIDFDTSQAPEGFSQVNMEAFAQGLIKNTADRLSYIHSETIKTEDGIIIHTTQTRVENHEPINIYTWRYFKLYVDAINVAHFNLVALKNSLPAKEEEGLVNLIGESIREARIEGLPAFPPSSTGRYASLYSPLLGLSFFDRITLRLPANWCCEQDNKGAWACWDNCEEERVVLWIDAFQTDEPDFDNIPKVKDPELLKQLANGFKDIETKNGGALIRHESIILNNGFILFTENRFAEDDTPAMLYGWLYGRFIGKKLFNIRFSLSVAIDRLVPEEEKQIVQLIGDEIHTAIIEDALVVPSS